MNRAQLPVPYSIPAFLSALVLSAALAGCGASGGSGAAGNHQGRPGGAGQQDTRGNAGAIIPVLSVQVAEGPLTIESDTAGTVQPITQSNVVAKIAGTVASVRHVAGDWVKAGETVVQLDDTQLKLAVKMAQSSLDNAKITLATNEDTTNQAHPKLTFDVQSAEAAVAAAQKNYDAAQALLKVGGATLSQVDSAQSQLQAAQATLDTARTNLDLNNKADVQTLAQLRIAVDMAQNQLQQAQLNLQYSSITAPFPGQLAVVSVNPGEYVGANTTAFVLVSAGKQLDFNVPPSDAPHLPIGIKLTFSYEGQNFPITVSQLPSAPVNGAVPMVASLSPSFPLAYGTVGTVSYTLSMARGILVPIPALQTLEDKNFVFVIENGKAVMHTITVIAESGVTAALSGIAPGAQVIVNPPPGLLDGSLVQPVQAAETGESSGSPAVQTGKGPTSQQPASAGQAASSGVTANK
jgi:multidrug efflux pump subunit AcrA (membrane-fusion protein)